MSGAALATVVGAVTGALVSPAITLLTARPPLREGAEPLGLPFRCASCAVPIAAIDALPLVSWARLRGRCRACGAQIPWHQPAGEIAAIALGALVGARVGWHADLPAHLLVALVLVVVTLVDARIHRIPTRLVYPASGALVALLALAAAVDGSWGAFGRSVAGGLAASGFLWVLVLLVPRAMGAGDARLCLLLGLLLGWHGWRHTYFGLLLGFLLASVVGVALMVVGRAGRRTQLAFGPYLAAGALVLALWPGIVG